MAATGAEKFRLTVLNPGGRDPEQNFGENTAPADGKHAPVNFHGFAACTRGVFHRDVKLAIAEKTPVLLLIRGDFKASERALTALKKAKLKVGVSLKETGLHQIAQQLADRGRLSRFLRIVSEADGCIGITPEAAEVFRRARRRDDPRSVAFIPTPYPVDDKQWDFSVPPPQQAGIFVGTREWSVPSRNHLDALLIARQLADATGEEVSVYNFSGKKGARLLKELKFAPGKLRVLDRRIPYIDYLREVGKHKIVLQLDRSCVPGQVAGDALLCRVACIGGNGTIERLTFPRSCGEGRTTDELTALAQQFLADMNMRAALVVEAQWRALERISFQAVRMELATFFSRL